jgi:hypothetical protein
MTITPPSIASSGTAVPNPTGQMCDVTVSGGTVTGAMVGLPAGLAATPVVTTPAVPASTGTATNTNAFPVAVAVSGGTVSVIAVNGVTIYSATGNTVVVPPGGTVGLTYTVAPTWVWTSLLAGFSGGSPFTVPVAPGALITLLYSSTPTWAWANPLNTSGAVNIGGQALFNNNSQAPSFLAGTGATAVGAQAPSSLPLASRSMGGQVGLGVAETN